MTISGSSIIILVCALLAIALVVYLRRYAVVVLSDVRAHFLTVHGFAVALLWWCVVSGALSSWIIFQVEVMGNDVAVTTSKSK
jgi:hypothetical protein